MQDYLSLEAIPNLGIKPKKNEKNKRINIPKKKIYSFSFILSFLFLILIFTIIFLFQNVHRLNNEISSLTHQNTILNDQLYDKAKNLENFESEKKQLKQENIQMAEEIQKLYSELQKKNDIINLYDSIHKYD